MTTVILLIHVMICLALVGVVLLQRSEGGALGIGGGGGFMTGRGAANFLTRVTASLAAAFFATSLLLTLLASRSTAPGSIFDQSGSPAPQSGPSAPASPPSGTAPGAPAGRGGILDQLQPPAPGGPSVPQSK